MLIRLSRVIFNDHLMIMKGEGAFVLKVLDLLARHLDIGYKKIMNTAFS